MRWYGYIPLALAFLTAGYGLSKRKEIAEYFQSLKPVVLELKEQAPSLYEGIEEEKRAKFIDDEVRLKQEQLRIIKDEISRLGDEIRELREEYSEGGRNAIVVKPYTRTTVFLDLDGDKALEIIEVNVTTMGEAHIYKIDKEIGKYNKIGCVNTRGGTVKFFPKGKWEIGK